VNAAHYTLWGEPDALLALVRETVGIEEAR